MDFCSTECTLKFPVMLQSVIIIWQLLFWAISHVKVSLTSNVSATNDLSPSVVVIRHGHMLCIYPRYAVEGGCPVTGTDYLGKSGWSQVDRSHIPFCLTICTLGMKKDTTSLHQFLMTESSSPWNIGQELHIHMADHPRRLQSSNNYADYKQKRFSILTGMLLQQRMWTHHKSTERYYVYKFGKKVKSTLEQTLRRNRGIAPLSFTLVLDKGGWSMPYPHYFMFRKEIWYLLHRKLGRF